MCKYFFIFFDFSFFFDNTPIENFHALRTQIYALYARFSLHTRTTTRENTTSTLFLSCSQTRTKNLQKYIFVCVCQIFCVTLHAICEYA